MKSNLKHTIRNVVNSMFNSIYLILKTLLPQLCIICGKSYMDKALCIKCYNKMPKSQPIGVNWIYSDLNYNDDKVKKCIHHFKYYNKKEIIIDMTNYYIVNMYSHIKDRVKQNYLSIQDIKRNGDDKYATIYLIPIPISPDRLVERGYNQSMIIAHTMSKNIDFMLKHKPFIKEGLKIITLENFIIKNKVSTKLSQTHNITDRVKATENSMQINNEITNNNKKEITNNNLKDNLQYENSLYVLLDDVTTTGTTFYTARTCLMSVGIPADNIIAISLAH